MKTIAWIYDAPGWAYQNRARGIAACLPQYRHKFVEYPREGFLGVLGADVIICPDPRVLPCFGASQKVVLNLNAIKLFVVGT